jgi:hypothetical protein
MTLGMPFLGISVASASAEDCADPYASQAGVHSPVGSDSGTYTYQCTGQYAGKWTNGYYAYDPATGLRTPIYAPDYSYDCGSGQWTKAQWDYWASDNQYHLSRVPTSNPGLPTGCPVTTPDNTSAGGAGSAGDNSSATGTNGASGVNNTGPGGSNTINDNLNNAYNANNTANATMNNTITSVGASGNALVLGNTAAGDATSGNVTDIANIVNMLQSSSNALGSDSNLIVFTKDINGDVNGDLLLDPSMLSQVQPASTNTINKDLTSNITVNNNSNSTINNNLNLGSTSGNATVASNTSGGNATSGNASSVANIVNLINSAITSGKSFLGVININGNLNGDILLPPDFVDQLVAANVPTVTISAPASTTSSNTGVNNTVDVTNTNNQNITNNIHATAASGTADVSNNTGAGNATSGSASTNITAFNLTGHKVVGANDLLVFVNVLGKWVGLIVNAPQGATAASLGGNLTENTTVNNNATVNNNVSQKINNNITTAAQSGDAKVNYNTQGGNAKSGNAHNAVNLMNVENSSISLTGWLGILFINVFGTWNGSFGVNTSAGDPIATAITDAQNQGSPVPQVFRFVPHSGSGGSARYDVTPYWSSATSGGNSSGGTQADSSGGGHANAILANAHIQNNKAPTPQDQGQQDSGFGGIASVIIGGAVVLYILGDAAYTRRHPERA